MNSDIQKHTLERVKQLIKLHSHLKMENTVPVKIVYKSILEFFLSKARKIETQGYEEAQNRIESNLYEFFSKNLGIRQLAEKRLKEFLLSCYAHRIHPKIQIFLRFLGLMTRIDYYRLSEELLYMEALQASLVEDRGFTVKPNFQTLTHNVPFSRMKKFYEKKLERNLDSEGKKFMKSEMARLNLKDENGMNLDGLIEFDKFMISCFTAVHMSLKNWKSKGIFEKII